MKLDKIRLATAEEVEKIASQSDLTPMSKVLSMGEIRAVWRITNELDPIYFHGAPNAQKYMFLWGMENILRGSGATELYFNVHDRDESFKQIVKHLGAVPTSTEPEIRYKITL